MSRTLLRPSYHQGYARSAGESEYPVLWKDLVGAWVPVMGPTGLAEVKDLSPYKNHATMVGTFAASDWDISGNVRMPGYALEFDGNDEYLEIPNLALFDDPTQLSIACQFKTGNASTSRVIESRDSSSPNNGYHIAIDATTGFCGFSIDTADGFFASKTGTDSSDGVWHSAVGLWSGSVIALLFDGVAQTPVATTGAISKNSVVRIGARTNATLSLFQGQIGVVIVWVRNLAPDEAHLLHRLPLAPFILRSRLAVKAPAAAGGLSIPVGMNQYFRQHSQPWM